MSALRERRTETGSPPSLPKRRRSRLDPAATVPTSPRGALLSARRRDSGDRAPVVSPVERPMSSPPERGARSSLWARLGRSASLVAAALLAVLASGDDLGGAPTKPTSEFHFVRMFYHDGALGRSPTGGFGDRSWTVDYPEAEYHFHLGVSRLTRVDIGQQARMLRVTDDAIFDYPWLYAVEVGRWHLDDDRGRAPARVPRSRRFPDGRTTSTARSSGRASSSRCGASSRTGRSSRSPRATRCSTCSTT